MEFQVSAIPKKIGPDSIELLSSQQFLDNFQKFIEERDPKLRIISIRKTGEICRLFFTINEAQDFLTTKLLPHLDKEQDHKAKLELLNQLPFFIQKINEKESTFPLIFELCKLKVLEEEELIPSITNVLKKQSEYCTADESVEYIDYLTTQIDSNDYTIREFGCKLFDYYLSKQTTNTNTKIYDLFKHMINHDNLDIRKMSVKIIIHFCRLKYETTETTEQLLLKASKDQVFSVRRSVCSTISNLTTYLTPSFISTLITQFQGDKSRFVQHALIINYGVLLQFIGKDLINKEMISFYSDCSNPKKFDCEFQYYCAFYFAKILDILGKDRWNELKSVFDALSLSIQSRVRKVMASSVHIIAKILGKDLTQSCLIPVLDKYLLDLDAIRQISMRHIVDFMAIGGEEQSVNILTLIQQTVQNPDWRVRRFVARQLGKLAECSPSFAQYIDEICTNLLVDQVYKVRVATAKEMGLVFKAFVKMKYESVTTLAQKILDVVDDSLKVRREIVVYSAVSVLDVFDESGYKALFGDCLNKIVVCQVPHTRVKLAEALFDLVKRNPARKNHPVVVELWSCLQKDKEQEVRRMLKDGVVGLFKKVKRQRNFDDPTEIVSTFQIESQK